MAGLVCSVNFDVTNIAADAWVTVASLRAPTNQMLKLLKANFFPNGTSGDAPHIDLRLSRVTAGSGTGTAVTPVKVNNAFTCTPQATARIAFTAEPTADGTLPFIYPSRTHPQGALMNEVVFDTVGVKEGTELALQAFVVTTTGLDPRGHLIYEE